jgi:hypothetical protein
MTILLTLSAIIDVIIGPELMYLGIIGTSESIASRHRVMIGNYQYCALIY